MQAQHPVRRHRWRDRPATLQLPGWAFWAHPPTVARLPSLRLPAALLCAALRHVPRLPRLTKTAHVGVCCVLLAARPRVPPPAHPSDRLPPPLQDTALFVVAKLVDPSQPPSRWPLEDLMWQLHGLVNSDPSQQHRDTLGGWARGWVAGWLGGGWKRPLSMLTAGWFSPGSARWQPAAPCCLQMLPWLHHALRLLLLLPLPLQACLTEPR